MQLRYLGCNRINVEIRTVRTTDCYVRRTLTRIGLSCLFLQRPRVATVLPYLLHMSKLPIQWRCCILFLSVLYIRVAPNYFFSLQFQHFKTFFPIYVCTYVCMYVCMYVCTSFGGLDSRYPAVPTVIQISIILLPISRNCWILKPDPHYSIVFVPLLLRYIFLSFFLF